MTGKTIKLNNGVEMPIIGLGTWRADQTGVLAETIDTAVKLGYRHIDCAKIYGNQVEIGEALKKVSVPRSELFVVSKIYQNNHRPERVEGAANEILNELQLDYLDLLLMHWPYSLKPETDKIEHTSSDIENVPIMDTWRAMEKLVDSGKVRAIGVSNFNKTILEKMLPQCRIKPAVNQVEHHPYNQENDLVKFCQDNGVVVTGYCPLGGVRINVMGDDTIKQIASAHNCSPAQVALSWAISKNIVVIPKSTNPNRLKLNLEVVELTKDDISKIDSITRKERKVDPSKDFPELTWVFHADKATCPVI